MFINKKTVAVSAVAVIFAAALLANGRKEDRQGLQEVPVQFASSARRSIQPAEFTDRAAPVRGSREGVSHQHYVDRSVPWSVNVVRIDRTHTAYELATALAEGSYIGLSPLTEQLRRIPSEVGKPVAAINGDFYITEHHRYAGDPRGLQIRHGELVSAPNGSTALWIDTNGAPTMGEVSAKFLVKWPDGDLLPFGLNEARVGGATLYTSAMGPVTKTPGGTEFILEPITPGKWSSLRPGQSFSARIREIRNSGNSRIAPETMVLSMSQLRPGSGASKAKVGDILQISTDTIPSLRGIKTAIGGGPELVRNGKAQPARVSKSRDRHPRSAVGWNDKEIFFVQVDGRQGRLSIGMSLPELADFMVQLGCDQAMNLDGGGSSEIWMDGKILNSPCYGHERDTANALVLVEKTPEARP